VGRRRRATLLLGVPLGLSLLWWLHDADRRMGQVLPTSAAVVAPHRPTVHGRRHAVAAPAVVPEEAAEATEPVEPPAVSTGLLRITAVREDGSPEPDAEIVVGQCGAWSVLEDSPAESVIQAEEGDCEISGFRRDGLLSTRADTVVGTVTAGGSASVELVFPSNRTGGIGISFRPAAEGMEVVWVRAGSPAEQAGLQPGDVVVDVDGEDAASLSTGDFVDLMTGPEGSPISFTIAYPGDTGQVADTLELTRAYIAPDRS
jgi:membrane-associated protease RseP (regulator of RpoE activity)